MSDKTAGRIWWLVLPAVIVLGGLGYYGYSITGPEQEEVLVVTELSPVDQKASSKEKPGTENITKTSTVSQPIPIEKKSLLEKTLDVGNSPEKKEELLQEMRTATEDKIERLFVPKKGDLFGKAVADKTYCDLIDEYVADFFSYLDTRKYIERLDLKTNTYAYFKKIIRTLAARPPVPAGEGFVPTVMLKNIFFFSRVLDRKDLRLFKEVVVNERDNPGDQSGNVLQVGYVGETIPGSRAGKASI